MSSARSKLFCETLSLDLKQLVTIATFISFFQITTSETCLYKSPCECVFQNGSVINLNSLGYPTEARWQNIKPTNKENYTYYYNPCFSFSLGSDNSGCAKGVAVCQASLNGDYYDCGDQNVHFSLDSATNLLHMIYTAPPRTTNVTLICSSEAYEPKLEVKGETEKNLYEMTLTSRCACPDLCRKSHLSTGSVLVIIFFIFVTLYLFLGIIHSNLTRGAQGWELLPHYEFWSDFPLLVRDGCVFVINGCKTETGYDRI